MSEPGLYPVPPILVPAKALARRPLTAAMLSQGCRHLSAELVDFLGQLVELREVDFGRHGTEQVVEPLHEIAPHRHDRLVELAHDVTASMASIAEVWKSQAVSASSIVCAQLVTACSTPPDVMAPPLMKWSSTPAVCSAV